MNLDPFLQAIDRSRTWFFKLVDGLTPQQWDAKPYPNVKSPRETLEHLVISDRVCPVLLQGTEPDYEAYRPEGELSPEQLLDLLRSTHAERMSWLKEFTEGKSADDTIRTVYSGEQSLASQLIDIATEDWYHIGQVSLVRQGVDPAWDYYAAFYSG
ncbi:MAG: DinB family protein [Armatimonadetes bacterium]|nr:MAG: DinB family protein [Armatimonadota bacterium]